VHTAVRDNLPEFLSKLLSLGADPNMLGGEGLPLLSAACQQDPKRLNILLDAGANVNIVRDGWTALMWACEKGSVENVSLLVQRGADANVVDGRGRSAMEIAAEKGHDELVLLLLDAMG
jgi:ankyrin repeat protein